MIVLTDIGLPIVLFDPDSDFNKNKTSIVDTTETASTDTTTSSNSKVDSFLGYGILLFLLILVLACLILIISCSYTIIMLYSMNKRLFISGDFLSGKKINDSISLMKTVKEICVLYVIAISIFGNLHHQKHLFFSMKIFIFLIINWFMELVYL